MNKENNTKASTRKVLWAFLGIFAFLTIVFPFFSTNLRYQARAFFSGIFGNIINTIGTICLTIGMLVFVFGLFSLFCGRSGSALKIMIMGLFLVLMGTYFTDFRFFTFIEGSNAPSMSNGYW